MTSPTEAGVAQCLPWESLLEYEQADILRTTIDILSSSFLQRDDLSLTVREEIESTSGGEPLRMSSLLLHGRVGYARREALLSLVRWLRLKHVEDLATSVTAGWVVGDGVPPLMLHPLVETTNVRSYRRWHVVRAAMQAGLLRKIMEHREHMWSRLRLLLRPMGGPASSRRFDATDVTGSEGTVSGGDFMFSPASSKKSVTPPKSRRSSQPLLQLDEMAAAEITELLGHDTSSSSPLSKKDSQVRRLALFEAGVRERRVDVRAVAATVPTVFVVWSHLFDECTAWLRASLFNPAATRDLDRVEGGVPRRFGVLFGIDPWMRFVEQYAAIPARRRQDEWTQEHRVLPITPKRAQIVLVNADRDRGAARAAYRDLLAACEGWSSPEVSLLSLWAGEEGMHSPFCTEVGADNLPFLLVTEPMRRKLNTYKLRRPYVVYTDFTKDLSGPPSLRPQQQQEAATAAAVASAPAALLVPHMDAAEGSWGALTKARREELCASLLAKLARAAVPLRMSAHVDRHYTVARRRAGGGAGGADRARRGTVTSTVSLHGMVSDRDLVELRDELVALASVTDFRMEAQVVRVAGPLTITLDRPSPSRVVQGVRRSVVCAACRSPMDLDTTAHFRCLHCSRQEQATLCEGCVRAQAGHHPDKLDALAAVQEQQQARRRRAHSRGRRVDHGTAPSPALDLGLGWVHPPNHILLRLPPLTGALVSAEEGREVRTGPLLWGPGNVVLLPRFCGRVMAGTRGLHVGVYCNRCSEMVRGVRWKCAVCYAFDLCDQCFLAHGPGGAALRGAGEKGGPLSAVVKAAAAAPCVGQPPSLEARPRGHAPWHPMLYIRYALDSDADDFLQPEMVDHPLEELCATATAAGEDASPSRERPQKGDRLMYSDRITSYAAGVQP